MDINVVRSIVTVVSFVLFVAILVQVLKRSRRAEYEQAALQPFQDDDRPAQQP